MTTTMAETRTVTPPAPARVRARIVERAPARRAPGLASSDWGAVDRMLEFGAVRSTCHVGPWGWVPMDAASLERLARVDGVGVVKRVLERSMSGTLPWSDPAFHLLALVLMRGDASARRFALEVLPRVCRTPAHLYRLARRMDGVAAGGLGSESFRTVRARLSEGGGSDALASLVEAFDAVRRAVRVAEVVRWIAQFRLPREAVPRRWLGEPEVWRALLPALPLPELARSLGWMTASGFLTPGSAEAAEVVRRLRQTGALRVSGVHPLALFAARRVYERGGAVGAGTCWQPVPEVVDALHGAFETSLSVMPRVGRPLLLALDVSGSMASSRIPGLGLSAREASAALASILVTGEPGSVAVAFTAPAGGLGGRWGGGTPALTLLELEPGMRPDEAVRRVSALPFGGVDVALPMAWARRHGLHVGGFVTMTDHETWCGGAGAAAALRAYRAERNPAARLVTLGMTGMPSRVADPGDPGMLDIAGFDATVPRVISAFLRAGDAR